MANVTPELIEWLHFSFPENVKEIIQNIEKISEGAFQILEAMINQFSYTINEVEILLENPDFISNYHQHVRELINNNLLIQDKLASANLVFKPYVDKIQKNMTADENLFFNFSPNPIPSFFTPTETFEKVFTHLTTNQKTFEKVATIPKEPSLAEMLQAINKPSTNKTTKDVLLKFHELFRTLSLTLYQEEKHRTHPAEQLIEVLNNIHRGDANTILHQLNNQLITPARSEDLTPAQRCDTNKHIKDKFFAPVLKQILNHLSTYLEKAISPKSLFIKKETSELFLSLLKFHQKMETIYNEKGTKQTKFIKLINLLFNQETQLGLPITDRDSFAINVQPTQESTSLTSTKEREKEKNRLHCVKKRLLTKKINQLLSCMISNSGKTLLKLSEQCNEKEYFSTQNFAQLPTLTFLNNSNNNSTLQLTSRPVEESPAKRQRSA